MLKRGKKTRVVPPLKAQLLQGRGPSIDRIFQQRSAAHAQLHALSKVKLDLYLFYAKREDPLAHESLSRSVAALEFQTAFQSRKHFTEIYRHLHLYVTLISF